MVRDVLGLLPSEPRDLSSVRLASAADPAIAADLRQVIPGVATTNPYGMTETYAPAAAASPSSPAEQHVTAGLPLDGVEVRVIDPATGADLPRGQAGEGLVRGMVMRGYWNQPEATAAALDADGWMHTGDLLRIEDDGRIVYAGRIKNMLRVGSENVSAEEVEAVLSGHPAVHSAAVLGVKDPRRDEVPWAYVQLHAGAEATEVDLERWCREQLASFKVPRRFVILDELPVAGSGKLDRLAIRKLADEASAT
jgi:fatty-acyl-CoA synthase